MAFEMFNALFSPVLSATHGPQESDTKSSSSRKSSLTIVESEPSRDDETCSPNSTTVDSFLSACTSKVQPNQELSDEPTKPVEHLVRLCPHETLSFDRVQRILALPDFKGHKKGVNACSIPR